MVSGISSSSGTLICIVCGVIDATCFVGLGGTFAGLMTGNLILMGVSFGGAGSGVATAVFLYPLGGYALGAMLAGMWFKYRPAQSSGHYGLWLGWCVLAAATTLAWIIPVTPTVGAGTAIGPSSWLLVALAALYMGFQSAVLYLSKRLTITTNVMTSTLTSFLADYPTQVTHRAVSWNKLCALLAFLLGVVIGAWLIPLGIHFGFSLSLVLATLAIFGISRSAQSEASR
jgi:uncharacterized membrane protein YoaK (UPF0700 family)